MVLAAWKIECTVPAIFPAVASFWPMFWNDQLFTSLFPKDLIYIQMETLAVRRIHVSSDFRLPGQTPSIFSIRLSSSVLLPEDTVAYIDNISLDNTFMTITTNHNDLLYVAEKQGATTEVRSVQLPQGNYSLVSFAAALKTALNTGHSVFLGSNPYNATHNLQEGNVEITAVNSFTFVILSDEQIALHDGTGLTINKNNPRSANKVIRNTRNGNTSSSPANYTYYTELITGFVALLPVKNVYVHSNLADNAVMTPLGLGDCVCCIPINSSYGTSVHHNMTSQADAINVSRRSFESLSFQLRDGHGNILETNEGFFSCSIIFMLKPN